VLNSNNLLGIECIAVVVSQRLRWFGHVERKVTDDWVSASRSYGVMEQKSRGRKTWDECVKEDLVELGLHRKWTLV